MKQRFSSIFGGFFKEFPIDSWGKRRGVVEKRYAKNDWVHTTTEVIVQKGGKK
jgi:hypothetical protein